MWLALTIVSLALWFLAVGVFNVAGNAIHLIAVLAMVALGVHLKGRRKVASPR
jgi:hypothetical protein